jgi:hypothetical protein
MVKKEYILHEMSTVTQNEQFPCESLVFYSQNFVKKLYVMDKSGYDCRIQRAEIDKEDIKYFKGENHCLRVLSVSICGNLADI